MSPQRGSAFWFFTLDDLGRFDGSSWHGGAAVAGELGMPGFGGWPGGSNRGWWLFVVALEPYVKSFVLKSFRSQLLRVFLEPMM